MWTCRNCSTHADVATEVCPVCGAIDLEISAADDPIPARRQPEADEETPTEYDVQDLPDPGPTVVECYIGVTAAEASDVADRLRDQGIPVYVGQDESAVEPIHRVRVPIVDLGRALAVIDLLHKRRTARF